MKKLLLIIIFLNFTSLVFSNDDDTTLFLEEVEKLNITKHNRQHVGNGQPVTDSLRYTKDVQELLLFKSIIFNPISNNTKVINKWSKGTFSLIEKNIYSYDYDNYNIFFGNSSIVFKKSNFGTFESVYIITQKPNQLLS